MRKFLIAATVALMLPSFALAETVVVFAAASLKPALDPVATIWGEATGNTAVISYGGSAALAKQIELGAPAEVFLSAAKNWMDVLEAGNHLADGTRVDLWGNALAVVGYDKVTIPFAMTEETDLASLIGAEKLAMGLVDSVPVGQYGKEALVTLGLWDSVAPQVVQTEDARATLALVATGEAAFGIVYATDAKAAEAAGQAIEVSRFPESSHRPIVYPGAVVAGANKPEAAAFLGFLQSRQASAVFAAQGFVILTR